MNPISFLSHQIFQNPVRAFTDTQAAVLSPPETGLTDSKTEQTAVGRKVARQPDFDTYECQTCKSRKYKDGSDDPSVSFKTATHLDPEAAPYAIRSHEGEHVAHNRARAQRENREIVSQTVTYHTDICPECGKVYMSGGTTRTVSKGGGEKNPYEGRNDQKGVYLDLIA